MFTKDTFNSLWRLAHEKEMKLDYPCKVICATANYAGIGNAYAATVLCYADVVYQTQDGMFVYLSGTYNSHGQGDVYSQMFSKAPTFGDLYKINPTLRTATWQADNLKNTLPDKDFENGCTVVSKLAARLFAGMFCLDLGTSNDTKARKVLLTLNNK